MLPFCLPCQTNALPRASRPRHLAPRQRALASLALRGARVALPRASRYPRLVRRQRAFAHISRYAARARRPAAYVLLAAPSPAPARLCPHFALRGTRAAPMRAPRQP